MFWNVFYKLCEEKNIKPNAVAKTIGVSNATCTKWKNGTIPNGETLLKLADYLNVSVDYLLGRTEVPQTIKNSETNQHTERNINITDNSETMELIEMIRNLSLIERSKVIIFIDELKNKQQTPIQPIIQSKPPIQQQPVQPPVVQSSLQRQIQQPLQQPNLQRQMPVQPVSNELTSQSKIQIDPKKPWKLTARRTDGVYESRLATPEELEKLRLILEDSENGPEPEY